MVTNTVPSINNALQSELKRIRHKQLDGTDTEHDISMMRSVKAKLAELNHLEQ